LRILISVSHLGLVGGVQTYLKSLFPKLIDKGYSLGLVYQFKSPDGLETVLLDHHRVQTFHMDNCDYNKTLKAIESWRPDIVFNQGLSNTNFESELANKYPTIFYAHSTYGSCISGTKMFSFPNNKGCSKALDNKCVLNYALRGCGGRNIFKAFKLLKNSLAQKKNLYKYKKILVASDWMRQVLIQNIGCFAKVEKVPLFPTAFLASEEPPKPKKVFDYSLLFVGRISKYKGWDHAIAATEVASCRLGRPLALTIVGSGYDEKRLRLKIRGAKIPVIYHGWLSSEQIEREYRKADVLLVPSLWGEPFGLVGIEAGCFGLPVAGYRVGGISDWLIPGVTGECGRDGEISIKTLSDCIVRIMSEINYRNNLSSNAWAHSKAYGLDSHVHQLEKHFVSIVK
jgi:glycosyltransferase involved in cell wall biosynthesis